jgi:hypothetical protein
VPVGIITGTEDLNSSPQDVFAPRNFRGNVVTTVPKIRFLSFRAGAAIHAWPKMTKEEDTKKSSLRIAIVALLCLQASLMHAQDQAAGEKFFKAKCAGCRDADAAGKAATKGLPSKVNLRMRSPNTSLLHRSTPPSRS